MEALGEYVRRRRERMGLTIDQAAEAGGISPVTWSRVELGRKVRRLTYSTVDTVLRWREGASLDFLEDGAEPAPASQTIEPATVRASAAVGTPEVVRQAADLTGLPEDQAERVAELSRRLADNAHEHQQIASELARLLGRNGPGASQAG